MDISEVIRSKKFDPQIHWLRDLKKDRFYADPFINKTGEGAYELLFESFQESDGYGKLAVMSVDADLRLGNFQLILDTKSHLSYPFIFREGNKSYVFPESAQSGTFSCYEYNPERRSLQFRQILLDLPLLDGTILKRDGKYWLFAVMRGKQAPGNYELCVFFADQLLGPYSAHPGNPISRSMDGTRPAGNFLEVDGELYRPAQNCSRKYGESITIQKVKVLNERIIEEEVYMVLELNRRNRSNAGIETIHTINVADQLIAIDGIRSRFSPLVKLKRFLSKRQPGK